MPHTLPTLAQHGSGHWIPNTPTASNERWLRRPVQTPAEVVIGRLSEEACLEVVNGGQQCKFCHGRVAILCGAKAEDALDTMLPRLRCTHTPTCAWRRARAGEDFDPVAFDAFEHHGGLMLHPSDDDRGVYDSVRTAPPARWDWATPTED